MIYRMFAGLGLHYTAPARHLAAAGYDLDALDREISDLTCRRCGTLV